MKWSQIPRKIRDTVWSSKCLPKGWDYELNIEMVEVGPLYASLSLIGDSGLSEFDSCQVYDDDVADDYTEEDLRHPIIIDRRLNGMQANVADGLHRIMRAHQLGVKSIPAIDVTEMFLKAGMPQASNNY